MTKQKPPPKKLRVSPKFAISYLGVTERTLKRWRAERRIPYYRLGHSTVVYDIRDLDSFLAANRIESM